MAVKPSIGRIVIYTSKIDNGPGNEVQSPAMVIRTRDTTVAEVAERWGRLGGGNVVHSAIDDTTHTTAPYPEGFVPELPDDETIDLVVFGLGKTYREYCVAHGTGLGQWEWPSLLMMQKEDEPLG